LAGVSAPFNTPIASPGRRAETREHSRNLFADRRRIVARQVAEVLEDAQVAIDDFQARHEQDAAPLALAPFCNAILGGR
jgi:hypothetical protein